MIREHQPALAPADVRLIDDRPTGRTLGVGHDVVALQFTGQIR